MSGTEPCGHVSWRLTRNVSLARLPASFQSQRTLTAKKPGDSLPTRTGQSLEFPTQRNINMDGFGSTLKRLMSTASGRHEPLPGMKKVWKAWEPIDGQITQHLSPNEQKVSLDALSRFALLY